MHTKIRENFVQIKQNVGIIHTSKSMESVGEQTVVWIKQNVRIIQDHIIGTLLYLCSFYNLDMAV